MGTTDLKNNRVLHVAICVNRATTDEIREIRTLSRRRRRKKKKEKRKRSSLCIKEKKCDVDVRNEQAMIAKGNMPWYVQDDTDRVRGRMPPKSPPQLSSGRYPPSRPLVAPESCT